MIQRVYMVISMSIKQQHAEKVSMGIQMQQHWTSVSHKENCSFLSLNKATCKQRQQASHQLSHYNITKWKTDLVISEALMCSQKLKHKQTIYTAQQATYN